jgi:hypothetical protein
VATQFSAILSYYDSGRVLYYFVHGNVQGTLVNYTIHHCASPPVTVASGMLGEQVVSLTQREFISSQEDDLRFFTRIVLAEALGCTTARLQFQSFVQA